MFGKLIQKNIHLLRTSDKFAHYRHAVGLPAIAVNTWSWGKMGMSTQPEQKTYLNLQEQVTDLEYGLNPPKSQTGILNKELNNSNITTLEEIAQLIKDDCQLPESIRSAPDQKKFETKNISQVLLTGCTGHLGPYILKELTNMPQVTKVICLVRPKKNISGEARLKAILEEQDLQSEVDMAKVHCVTGNVALPHLGMEETVWEELCNNVDGVFHCAANVTHVEQYKKRQSDRDSRAVNVGGTKNVLEFACAGDKLKHVFCASTTLGVVTVDENGGYSESWPEPSDFDGVTTLAYPISKFVGEMLMKQAVLERDIPGKVFRFPLIVGDSRTGRCKVHHNHFMLRNFFALQHKILSSHPIPIPIVPVDICAWASVQIFFNPNAPDDIYNVFNSHPVTDQEFISVAKRFGFDIEMIPFPEFSKKIRESSPADSPFAIFKEFYSSDDALMSWFNKSPKIKNWINAGFPDKNFMVSEKIGSLLPEFLTRGGTNEDHLYRDLLFAKNQGWFEKYRVV